MKKKLIEKMNPPRLKRGMKGTVAIARIPAEGLLTIDIVNVKPKKVEVRICVTKKEFANYYPDTGKWDNKLTEYVCDSWNTKVYDKQYIEQVLYTTVYGYPLRDVGRFERNLNSEKRERAEHRKYERCKERNERLPDISEEEKEWLTRYVDGFHYMYYKRHGKYADVACSNCNMFGTAIIKPETFEDYVKLSLEDFPKHNDYTDCPWCHARVQYKAEGRQCKDIEKSDSKYILYPDGNGSVVVRYFEICKRAWGTSKAAWENTYIEEFARTWFTGNTIQTDWRKYDGYLDRTFWDYKNLYGMANRTMKAGKVYRGNLSFLQDTDLKYACIQQALLQNDYENMINYIGAYKKFPVLEMLTKLGMWNMRTYILENWRWTSKLNSKGKKPEEIFKITKQRFADMKKNNGNALLLDIYQTEKIRGKQFTVKELELMKKLQLSVKNMQIVLKYATPIKLMNYIEKQKDIVSENLFGYQDKINQTTVMYVDYIKMCETNERDLTNPHKVYPQELLQAHDREYVFMNKNREEKEKKEKNKKNPNIKKDAAGYNRQYRYQNEKYLIRAPKDAGEILEEGLTLDHCVGRMGYIEAMNRHETLILFLRKRKEKDIPYYTLEVKNGQITQAYGKHDLKPDWEDVRPFIEAFKDAKLKKKEERLVG